MFVVLLLYYLYYTTLFTSSSKCFILPPHRDTAETLPAGRCALVDSVPAEPAGMHLRR